jgi:hypothetical protein
MKRLSRKPGGRGGGRKERPDPNCKAGLNRGFLKKKKKKPKKISGITSIDVISYSNAYDK